MQYSSVDKYATKKCVGCEKLFKPLGFGNHQASCSKLHNNLINTIRDLLAIVEVTYTGDQEVIDRAKKLIGDTQ